MAKNSTSLNSQVLQPRAVRPAVRPSHQLLAQIKQFARAYTCVPTSFPIGGIVLN